MKTSLFNSILCASLLIFAVGCGKSSSGGSKSNGYINPYVNPNMPVSGQTALNNLKAWYAAPETTASLGFRGTYIKETKTISTFNFQGSLCIFGWGINCNDTIPTPTNCFRKNVSSNNYDTGTATGNLLNECTITQQNVTKATNTELQNALNRQDLILVDVQQQGSVYYLVYGNSNLTPSVVYTIDTTHHSILNPVSVQSLSNRTQTVIKGLQIFNF